MYVNELTKLNASKQNKTVWVGIHLKKNPYYMSVFNERYHDTKYFSLKSGPNGCIYFWNGIDTKKVKKEKKI